MKFKKLPNIDRRAYKGIFKPNNPQKYKGNVKNIVYRSSWEKRFMNYCDRTREIIEWGSEELSIFYRGVDGKPHRYYPDFYMKLKDGKRYVIEVKPKRQCVPPIKGKKQKKRLEDILRLKNVVSYEGREFVQAEADKLIKSVTRFFDWAEGKVA